MPFTFGEESLNVGDPVTVTCAVIGGDKPMTVLWTFQGSNVSQDIGISTVPLGDSGSILTIGSVRAGHAGNYTCLVRNQAGMISQTSLLRVTGNVTQQYIMRNCMTS